MNFIIYSVSNLKQHGTRNTFILVVLPLLSYNLLADYIKWDGDLEHETPNLSNLSNFPNFPLSFFKMCESYNFNKRLCNTR
jgi:hypothetical protein